VPAYAQDDRPVKLTIGGGFTGVYGSASDRIGNGGNFTLGVLFRVNPIVSLQGEYAWNGMKKKRLVLPVVPVPNPLDSGVPTDFFADGNMQYGDVNLLLHVPVEGRTEPYFLTGLGVYYRPVNVTTPGVGYTTFCDPYWYYCYPTLVEVDQVVGSRSSTDFGMNFGGGVNFKLTDTTSMYLEIRYHYVWGPSIDEASIPAGVQLNSTKANGQFLPITLGFRF
jgi:opacity protein-like surface antigen